MQHQGPSRTAIRTAIYRAAHLLLDDDPKILIDMFARAFAGYDSEADLLRALESIQPFGFPLAAPCLRAIFTARNRYAEDELADAAKRGVAQYVILGAGLDSFAYRRPELMASLDVFEIDYPASRPGNARGSRNSGSLPRHACIIYLLISRGRHLPRVSRTARSILMHRHSFPCLAWRNISPRTPCRKCCAMWPKRPRQAANSFCST